MRFEGTILASGKSATGIEVPAEVVERLGSKRPKVRVKINGFEYRTSVGSMGGRFMLPVSAAVREQAEVAAGDTVVVTLEPDTEPREVALPPDFARALRRDAAAKRFFDTLSYSQQRWFVEGIESAKKPETRRRRIEASVARLHEGRGQR